MLNGHLLFVLILTLAAILHPDMAWSSNEMNPDEYTIVGIGELLWDLLPEGKKLGGAPANFAYMSSMLGDRSIIASRIGDDELGREAAERLSQIGLMNRYVQVDEKHATGTVRVDVDETGQPDFIITEEAAWDYIQFTHGWQEMARRADAICYGSLAQRSPASREAILSFLRASRSEALRVYDVNLRPPFYSASVLHESLKLSRIVKLNDQELPVVMGLLGLSGNGDVESGRTLLRAYGLEMVCMTRGARGSILVSGAEVVEHPGLRVDVADTVGAGDAFTAALTHHYLRGAPLERISKAANLLGAWVASQTGAMPAIEPGVLNQIVSGAGTL
jgi:fructokinase